MPGIEGQFLDGYIAAEPMRDFQNLGVITRARGLKHPDQLLSIEQSSLPIFQYCQLDISNFFACRLAHCELNASKPQ